MISQTVEYALRAAVSLASAPNALRTTSQLAEVTQVPAGYLSKVMQSLVDAGIVTSQRGPGGGFALIRTPDEISLLQVVNAVEPLQRIRSCPLRLSAHSVRLCALHQRLDDALATVEKAFAETTLAELVSDGRKDRPLCPTPAVRVNLGVGGKAMPGSPARRGRGRLPKTR